MCVCDEHGMVTYPRKGSLFMAMDHTTIPKLTTKRYNRRHELRRERMSSCGGETTDVLGRSYEEGMCLSYLYTSTFSL